MEQKQINRLCLFRRGKKKLNIRNGKLKKELAATGEKLSHEPKDQYQRASKKHKKSSRAFPSSSDFRHDRQFIDFVLENCIHERSPRNFSPYWTSGHKSGM